MTNNEVYPMLNETVEYKSVNKSSKLCSYILNFVRYLICIACAGFLAFFVHQYMVDDISCKHGNMTEEITSILQNIPLFISHSLHEEMDSRLAFYSLNLENKLESFFKKMMYNNTIT